jgi:peptidyl-tRNA hydrolase, PTH1 family
MYIIVGLGNPGREFEHTRHNMGFDVLDCLAKKHSINLNKVKFKGKCGEGFIGSEKVFLLKPQTYMNLSGESVLDAFQFYKLNIENLIIIFDDVSIPLGKIRLRPSGSDGGQKGMKSIIYILGSDNFPRLRVGIGAPKHDIVDHVIGRFSNSEQKVIDDIINVSADAVTSIVEKGITPAMNQYNSYKHESLNIVPPNEEIK